MKFAKVLQQTLIEEDIPEEWVEAAIQYKALKKYIGKVVHELEFLGLSKNDLKLLLDDKTELSEEDAVPTNPIVAEYSLQKLRNSKDIVAYLKITLNDSETKGYSQDHIHQLADQIRARIEKVSTSDDDDHHIVEVKEEDDRLVLSRSRSQSEELVTVQNNNEIIIMLKSDTKFFKMLNAELGNLDSLRDEEEKALIRAVDHISDAVLSFSHKKSDMYKWRELFRIYLESEVFFRYNETTLLLLQRSSEQIRANFNEFMSRVQKSHILESLDKKRSVVAFNEFVAVNERLLKILLFQAINSTALRKILKKFDKQTSLNISSKFPDLISKEHIFITGSSLAQSICFVMQSKLLTLIPQIDDYTCPICMSIAFKPIRLTCGHIFCVRCLVKLKQRHKLDCPLCRAKNAIENADSTNLDVETMKLMQKYFPNEVKEKLKEVDREKYGEVVVHDKQCAIS